MELKTLATGME